MDLNGEEGSTWVGFKPEVGLDERCDLAAGAMTSAACARRFRLRLKAAARCTVSCSGTRVLNNYAHQ